MNKTLIYLFLTFFFTISCQEILYNEDNKSRVLLLEDFHAVRFYGIYNIVLIQDSTNRLDITGKNDISSIEAIIIDDTLIINDHKKMYLNTNKSTLTLHFNQLQDIVTYDPVTISNTDTLRADRLNCDAIGEISEVRLTVDCDVFSIGNSANTMGFFYVSGKANYGAFFNRYGGSIFADSLYCKNIEIVNESVGDVYINASEYIKAYIWGPGNIYYYGSPAIEIAEKRGDGRLIGLHKK